MIKLKDNDPADPLMPVTMYSPTLYVPFILVLRIKQAISDGFQYYTIVHTIGIALDEKRLKRIFNNDDDLCLKLSRCEIAQIKEGDDRK